MIVAPGLHTLFITCCPLKSSRSTTGAGAGVILDAAAVLPASSFASQRSVCCLVVETGFVFSSCVIVVFLHAVKSKRMEIMIPGAFFLMVKI